MIAAIGSLSLTTYFTFYKGHKSNNSPSATPELADRPSSSVASKADKPSTDVDTLKKKGTKKNEKYYIVSLFFTISG